MKAMSFTSTKNLKKLVLHLAGDRNRYWDPCADPYDSKITWNTVLNVPTLNEVTLSCACIHDAVHFGEARSSNLKVLTLIECNVNIKGLENVLSSPKALEKLHLGILPCSS